MSPNSSAEAAGPSRSARRASDDLAFALFRPHLFFYRPWTGVGALTTTMGPKLRIGFTVSGDGRAASRQGHVEQHWSFDNGLTYSTEWKVVSTDGADYRAVDVRNGVEARGRQLGDAFLWWVRTKAPTPFGMRMVKVSTIYRMIGPGVAEAQTTTTLWGIIVLNRMTATYRRLDA